MDNILLDLAAPGGIWADAQMFRNGYHEHRGVQGALYVTPEAFANANKNSWGQQRARLPPPLALPGQWVIFNNEAKKLESIAWANDYSGLGWRYSFGYAASAVSGDQLYPHPRPDHGGAFLSPEVTAQTNVLEAQRRIMEVQVQKLDVIQALVTPVPVVIEEVVIPEPEGPGFLSATIDGAKNGIAAAVFVALAEQVRVRYKEIDDRWVPALPWLLCSGVYLGTLLFDKVPMAGSLRKVALAGISGTATILTVRLAKPIADFVERILQLEKIDEV